MYLHDIYDSIIDADFAAFSLESETAIDSIDEDTALGDILANENLKKYAKLVTELTTPQDTGTIALISVFLPLLCSESLTDSCCPLITDNLK